MTTQSSSKPLHILHYLFNWIYLCFSLFTLTPICQSTSHQSVCFSPPRGTTNIYPICRFFWPIRSLNHAHPGHTTRAEKLFSSLHLPTPVSLSFFFSFSLSQVTSDHEAAPQPQARLSLFLLLQGQLLMQVLTFILVILSLSLSLTLLVTKSASFICKL